jgi:tellurite resistance protein TehA-like permease
MTTASVLIVMIVATAVGGVIGMVLGGSVNVFVLATAAGFLGVLAAAIVRNYVLVRMAQSGPDDSGIPAVVIVFSAVASIAGSLAAEEISEELLQFPPALLGAFAGLLSSVLMIMLMVTYHMNPDKPSNRPFS